MTLHDLCLTDKYSYTDKYFGKKYACHSYVENIYNSLFEPLKESTKNILEIGIFKGDSLRLWRDFFQNAMVFGVDVNGPIDGIGTDRIIQLKSDAYSTNFVDMLPNDQFDIIIDDGPHTKDSQLAFIKNYASKVKQNGLLVCEDIDSVQVLGHLIQNIPNTCRQYQVFDLRDNDKRWDSLVLVVRK